MLDQYKATPNDLLLDLHELLQVALTYSIAQTKCLPLQMNEILQILDHILDQLMFEFLLIFNV